MHSIHGQAHDYGMQGNCPALCFLQLRMNARHGAYTGCFS